ncbi:MAG TPA: IS1634 family transposase [Coleofasciculaceae cyanobacterium]
MNQTSSPSYRVACSISPEKNRSLASADSDELYAAMDWLLERQGKIEKSLAIRHLKEGTLVLYDVSSTYFEGETCPLAQFGYSRDRKKGKLQIVFGLLCNAQGIPVAVEVFEGNTGDPATLAAQIEKVRHRFGLKRVVFVGDRGLITEARINEELKNIEGLDWITTLRAPQIRQLVERDYLQLSLFDQQDLASIQSPDYPGERLIACRNPILAAERARKREALLQATERELDKVVVATNREQRPLKGAANIGLRVGKVLNRFKVAKHFHLEITDNSFHYQRHSENIAAEAALDGLYVIRTSVSEQLFDSQETVRAYKSLSTVERAFRSYKTVDLKVRPICHRLEGRVRAHIFLCMLAYYVEWHMRSSLVAMLFDDEDKVLAEALRDSVVAPKKRSVKAQSKAVHKRTEDGLPVHSFQTLLKDLATIVKNRVQPKRPGAKVAFEKITCPTPLQQKAFDLLGVSYLM